MWLRFLIVFQIPPEGEVRAKVGPVFGDESFDRSGDEREALVVSWSICCMCNHHQSWRYIWRCISDWICTEFWHICDWLGWYSGWEGLGEALLKTRPWGFHSLLQFQPPCLASMLYLLSRFFLQFFPTFCTIHSNYLFLLYLINAPDYTMV